mmetsp:Transcript_96944/g.289594  ORF Transcript_96944/g.289594 Transcript_96944/m.289594 type:complete len:210 (+) Transcript_96944:300-929(+)
MECSCQHIDSSSIHAQPKTSSLGPPTSRTQCFTTSQSGCGTHRSLRCNSRWAQSGCSGRLATRPRTCTPYSATESAAPQPTVPSILSSHHLCVNGSKRTPLSNVISVTTGPPWTRWALQPVRPSLEKTGDPMRSFTRRMQLLGNLSNPTCTSARPQAAVHVATHRATSLAPPVHAACQGPRWQPSSHCRARPNEKCRDRSTAPSCTTTT